MPARKSSNEHVAIGFIQAADVRHDSLAVAGAGVVVGGLLSRLLTNADARWGFYIGVSQVESTADENPDLSPLVLADRARTHDRYASMTRHEKLGFELGVLLGSAELTIGRDQVPELLR